MSSERYTTAALWALYENTGGASWVNNTGWLGNTEPCGALLDDGSLDNSSVWFGVSECVHDGSRLHPRVSKLELSRNGLTGELPIELDLLGKAHSAARTHTKGGQRTRLLPALPPTASYEAAAPAQPP